MNKTLIILVIIGLVLAWKFVLFPQKLDFTDKMKVLHGLTLARGYQDAITRYWQEKQHFPDARQWQDDVPAVAVDLARSIVGSIRVAEQSPGSITLYYSNTRDSALAPAISGRSLTLTPYLQDGVLLWSCQGNVPAEFLPKHCH